MSKKTLLKSIIAVSAAATMLLSSTAFAAQIDSTRTLYVKGSTTTVEVATTVSGLTVGDEVTYLAGDASDPVYINQYTATKETETYTYKTTKLDQIGTATVKMAKTASDFTGGESINVEAASTIPDAAMFTFNVTIDTVAQDAITVNPNSVGDTVNVPLTLAAGKEIGTVKVNDADAAYVLGEGTITITHGVTVTVADDNTFGDASGNTSANIVITTKDAEEVTYEVPAYKSGFKASSYEYKYTENDVEKTISGPMYAIYAASDKLPADCTEFGVAINTNADVMADGWEYYKSTATKGDDFGIAIIEADADNIPDVVYARTYYTAGNVTTLSNDIITINVK